MDVEKDDREELRMIVDEIRMALYEMRDEKYRDFQGALIPTVPREDILGGRTPDLRRLAKGLSSREDIGIFTGSLPHRFFEENQLHAFLLCEIKDFDLALAGVEKFLPYVNNWATCDQLSPKAFSKAKVRLLPVVQSWLASGRTYTVRFAIATLMRHFLDEDFSPIYLEWVAAVRSEEYYVEMMIAWFFATALAKRYEETMPYIEGDKLPPFVRKKTIQKALESFRVSEEHKAVLRRLRKR